MHDAQGWIDTLDLQPHPEGGWYREVYRAAETIPREALPDRFSGDRSFSTAIYFLLRGDEFSAFHKIAQDEIWHFYDGSSLTVHMIDQAGQYSSIALGRNASAGQSLMAAVPAGRHFAAEVDDLASYALVGCTVAPGFDFDDFVMPAQEELLATFPQHAAVIERLARRAD